LAQINRIADTYQKILKEVSKAVIGKEGIKEALMMALLAEGHVLIEGWPGSAKTTLAKTFAQAIGGDFKRIQFTPDMMPADVTGFYLYSPDGQAPRFIPGPIFANVVLADELNRTTPRTQSAMLEAMQEHQVTIERTTHHLPGPFMVIATGVHSGSEGTYPLTGVQVDRFLLRVTSEYASKEDEKRIISGIDGIDEPNIKAVTTPGEIAEIQKVAKATYVSPDIVEYIAAIVHSVRTDADVLSGVSSRAGIALYKCARVLATLDGRDFVIPDDIKHLASPAIEHRITVKPEAEMDNITPKTILEKVLAQVPVPKIKI
jgi:MoxR-like ATPase